MRSREAEEIFVNSLIRIEYGSEVPESVKEQGAILLEALMIYAERNRSYKDNWRRYGWRGCLYDLRRKVERSWDALWNVEPVVSPPHDTDDLVDVINYAAITKRAVDEGNRDGEGGWW